MNSNQSDESDAIHDALVDAYRRGWADGHQTGWEHHQDGNYGNDWWDDDTPTPVPTDDRLCPHGCATQQPYGWVIAMGCPLHDAPISPARTSSR